MNAQRFAVAAVVTLLGTVGCAERSAPTAPTTTQRPLFDAASQLEIRRHVVVFAAERVPADFAERTARLGGSVEASLDSIGQGTSFAAPTVVGARCTTRGATGSRESRADPRADPPIGG